jgi:hypothetical protein
MYLYRGLPSGLASHIDRILRGTVEVCPSPSTTRLYDRSLWSGLAIISSTAVNPNLTTAARGAHRPDQGPYVFPRIDTIIASKAANFRWRSLKSSAKLARP